MSKNTAQVNRFIRNSLEGITNKTDDKFLSKLEDRILTMGQFIQQRHGMDSYRELLNAVCSDREI